MIKDFVLFGTITKTHGLHGAFAVESYFEKPFDIYKKFFLYIDCVLKEEKISISGILNNNRVIMQCDRINSIEEAKKIIASEIYISRSNMPQLADGEYYPCDLIGMDIIFNEVKIGVVSDVVNFGSGVNFEVKNSEEKLEYYVYDENTVIDLESRKIKVKILEYV